jgi:hypothetical protein
VVSKVRQISDLKMDKSGGSGSLSGVGVGWTIEERVSSWSANDEER